MVNIFARCTHRAPVLNPGLGEERGGTCPSAYADTRAAGLSLPTSSVPATTAAKA